MSPLDRAAIDALFPADLPEVGHWQQRYPLRSLPEGAQVTRVCPSPTGHRLRDDAEDGRQGEPGPPHRLRRHAHGVLRRGHARSSPPACIDQGLYFAMNSPAGATGGTGREAAAAFVNGLRLRHLGADAVRRRGGGARELDHLRTGEASTLAVGISQILSTVFGGGSAAFWYHFAVMSRRCSSSPPSTPAPGWAGSCCRTRSATSGPLGDLRGSRRPGRPALVVVGWGLHAVVGVTDPLGGINQLFPLFGIANQLLAAIALTLVTVLFVKHGGSATVGAGDPAGVGSRGHA